LPGQFPLDRCAQLHEVGLAHDPLDDPRLSIRKLVGVASMLPNARLIIAS
jgi:hypothetical protein